MPSLKNLLNPVALMAAALVFVFFLPDLDGFASTFRVAPQLFDLLTSIDDRRLEVLYGVLSCLLLAALSLTCATKWLRNTRLMLFLAGTIVVVIYCWILLFMQGLSLSAIVRTPSLIGIYLTALCAALVCGFAKDARILAGVAFGMLGAGGIRLLYAVYCYRRYGGIQIFEGTPALAMDGGLLVLWVLIAVWAGLQSLQYFQQRLLQGSFLMLLVAAVFTAAVGASFRRTVMLLLLGNLALAVVLYSWFRNRLASGIVWVGGMSLAMLVGLFVVMASVFGLTTATERVFSLTSSNSANSFSNSNEAYLDDQSALKETLPRSNFLGVGPGMPYAVSRISDEFSVETVVPLHTGTSELWASAGVFGLIYHLAFLLGLPVSCLRAYRRNPAGGDRSVVALVSSFIIFINIWPFAPPFYTSFQPSIIMGLCLGYLLHFANEARLRVPERRETVVASLVRPSRVNA